MSPSWPTANAIQCEAVNGDPDGSDDEDALARLDDKAIERMRPKGGVIAAVAISIGIVVGMFYFVVGLCS
jgi:hypothetical protein